MLEQRDIEILRQIFSDYDYIMTTAQLNTEKLYYRDIQRMLDTGLIEKIKRGYYHWIEDYGKSEVVIINSLFPDAVLCMETALFYYRYSDRNPAEWNITIDKNTSRQRTQIDYPFVKAYRVEPNLLSVGETKGKIDFTEVRIYDRDRTICDVLRNMNKMDKEIFNKAIQNYVTDPKKNIPNLMQYAKVLRVQKRVKDLIGKIIATPTGNDYIKMTAKGFEEIAPQRKYHGISTQIIGQIKNVRVPFNVDIGVGDVIVPKAERRKINTQLPDFEAPVIKTYSLESTIAEKFDAILQRFELTGRMKDFYDIYYLSKTFDFEGAKLQSAIFGTLQRRGTPYDIDSFKRVVSLADDEDMQKRWKYFLKNIKEESLEFSVVIAEIQTFLEPVFDAMVNEDEWQKSGTQ